MSGEGAVNNALPADSPHAAAAVDAELLETMAEEASSTDSSAMTDAAEPLEVRQEPEEHVAEERAPVKAPDALGGGQQTMAERMRVATAAKAEKRAALDAMSPEERAAAAAAEAEAAQHKRRQAKHLRKSVRVTKKGAASIRASLMKGRRRGGSTARTSSDVDALGAPPSEVNGDGADPPEDAEAWPAAKNEEHWLEPAANVGGTVQDGMGLQQQVVVPPRPRAQKHAAPLEVVAAPTAPLPGSQELVKEGAMPKRTSRSAPPQAELRADAHSSQQLVSRTSSAVDVRAVAVCGRETLNPLSVLDTDMLGALCAECAERNNNSTLPPKAGAGRPLPPIPPWQQKFHSAPARFTYWTSSPAKAAKEGSECCAIA